MARARIRALGSCSFLFGREEAHAIPLPSSRGAERRGDPSFNALFARHGLPRRPDGLLAMTAFSLEWFQLVIAKRGVPWRSIFQRALRSPWIAARASPARNDG